MERFEIVVDNEGNYCGLIPSENGPVVQYADAQAAIAALQADNRTYINERHDNMKQIEQLQADLAERTAERDTARRRVDELEAREVDVVLLREDLEQRTAELEAATRERYHAKKMEAVQKEVADNQTWHVQQLRAELERVRADNKALDEWRSDVTVSLQRPGGAFFVDVPQHIKDLVKERDDLRTLILALPKVEVEGEIEVSSGVYNFILLKHDSGTRFLCGQIETEQTAKAIAALWQHRQGMER